MALNFDLVGKQSEPIPHTYTWRDCVLYALGVGAKLPEELNFLYESDGHKVLPTFAVVPAFAGLVAACDQLGADRRNILHGEQTVIQHEPIPSSGTLTTSWSVTGIYDKGTGALAVIETRTTDTQGKPVFDNVFSLFVRGAGGFGGDRGPSSPRIDPPADTDPDITVTEVTTPEQAALYRLCGDRNPLHIDPTMAKSVGFERPILHGLCTFGFAGRALLHGVCGSDPKRFRSLQARFSGVVFPGDELTTAGWQIESGRYVVQVTKSDGTIVLSNAVAEVMPS